MSGHHNHHCHTPTAGHKPHYAFFSSCLTVGTVAILILIKSYAFYVSGAATMLATLTDSVVDAAVSLMLLFAVRYSLKPADKDHRHGHGKVEGIAALMQGAFLGGAGIFLGFEAFNRFVYPQELSHHALTIGVALIAIALTFIIVGVQKFALRYAPSLALASDHAHYKTDIFLNGSVIVAMLVNYYGTVTWIDPGFALLIAFYFMYTAISITSQSVDMLMDKELSPDIREEIEKLVAKNPKIHDMHDLRTRMSGMNMHISFDVELNPDLTLKAAHDIVRELDHAILAKYPNAEIIIHMDPIGDTADPRHSVKGVHH
jgi:ferrous-iron efflux pump FieF